MKIILPFLIILILIGTVAADIFEDAKTAEERRDEVIDSIHGNGAIEFADQPMINESEMVVVENIPPDVNDYIVKLIMGSLLAGILIIGFIIMRKHRYN